MARLTPRDGFVKEVTLNRQSGKKLIRADKSGMYSVDNPKDIKALKAEGFTESALNPFEQGDTTRGYTCLECGFGSWFRKCSRCGSEYPSEPLKDGD